MERLYKQLSKYDINHDNMTTPKKEAFEIMMSLSKDAYLDATDIMIVSHALSDPDSKFFFTPDIKLLDNQVIKETEKKLREDGRRNVKLTILDRHI